jgi:YHS domain-containing protein
VLRIILFSILLILVARAFWRVMDGVIEASGGRAPKPRARSTAVKLVRDPVCGTFVAPRPTLSLTSGGSTHYFCSERCREQFQRS